MSQMMDKPATTIRITRQAAFKRLGSMPLTPGAKDRVRARIRDLRGQVVTHTRALTHPDHHVLSAEAIAEAFACPHQRAEFLSTNWQDWFSKNCRQAITSATA